MFIFRKKDKEPEKNFQLDLCSPNDGFYKYSAVLTYNKQWDAKELLLFVSGCSGQENSFSELKTILLLATFQPTPTRLTRLTF